MNKFLAILNIFLRKQVFNYRRQKINNNVFNSFRKYKKLNLRISAIGLSQPEIIKPHFKNTSFLTHHEVIKYLIANNHKNVNSGNHQKHSNSLYIHGKSNDDASDNKDSKSFNKSDYFIVDLSTLYPVERNHFEQSNPSLETVLINVESLQSQESFFHEEFDIERYIRLAVEIFGKEKVLFFSSFVGAQGEEFEDKIVQFREIISSLGALYLDSSDCLDFWSFHEIFCLSNNSLKLTSTGLEIFGFRLRKLIHDHAVLFVEGRSLQKAALIQVIDNSNTKIQKSTFGFGDVLLGACFVYEEALRQGRTSAISWDQFSARQFLHVTETQSLPHSPQFQSEVAYIDHYSKDKDFKNKTLVSTNLRPIIPISYSTRDFLFRNGLNPTVELSIHLKRVIQRLEISPDKYQVVQIRVGDMYSFEERVDMDLIHDLCRKIISKMHQKILNQSDVIILSDSKFVLQVMRKFGWKTRNVDPVHLGVLSDAEAEKETLTDFFLLCGANRIIQFSNYYWGSGFSLVASQLCDVDLEAIYINELT